MAGNKHCDMEYYEVDKQPLYCTKHVVREITAEGIDRPVEAVMSTILNA